LIKCALAYSAAGKNLVEKMHGRFGFSDSLVLMDLVKCMGSGEVPGNVLFQLHGPSSRFGVFVSGATMAG
jgi:hypothetical protein